MSTNPASLPFLSGRAHYQILESPETMYDMQNGNEPPPLVYERPPLEYWSSDENGDSDHVMEDEWSPSTGYGSEVTLLDCQDHEYRCGDIDYRPGLTRRFKKRKSSSEDSEVMDTDASDLELCERGSPKTKMRNMYERCMNLRAILAALKARRKRKMSVENNNYADMVEAGPHVCTYKDSCRCLDCQSRYFECDDSCSDGSDSDNEDSEGSRQRKQNSSSGYDDDSDDNEEVYIDIPPDNQPRNAYEDPKRNMNSAASEGNVPDGMKLEMAAGTPVVLDYILHHPLTCTIM